MRHILAIALLLAPACHKEEPAQPTAEQSDQLNEADLMLNDLAKEKGPEADAPGPSNSSD